MKKVIYILFSCFVISAVACSVSQEPLGLSSAYFRVPSISIESDGLVSKYSEIRFYHIGSALDALLMLKKEYGDSDLIKPGKYQDNINQHAWENIDILNDGKLFTIIGDGTEDRAAFFASIMVFDTNGNDALCKDCEKRAKIIKTLVRQMKNAEYEFEEYQVWQINGSN